MAVHCKKPSGEAVDCNFRVVALIDIFGAEAGDFVADTAGVYYHDSIAGTWVESMAYYRRVGYVKTAVIDCCSGNHCYYISVIVVGIVVSVAGIHHGCCHETRETLQCSPPR